MCAKIIKLIRTEVIRKLYGSRAYIIACVCANIKWLICAYTVDHVCHSLTVNSSSELVNIPTFLRHIEIYSILFSCRFYSAEISCALNFLHEKGT